VKTRIALGALGVLVMGYAVWGAVQDTGTNLVGMLVFLAAVLVAHDVVLLPLGIAAGALVGLVVHRRYRMIVGLGLWTLLIVGLLALPFIVAG
jgi:hypothetical protein